MVLLPKIGRFSEGTKAELQRAAATMAKSAIFIFAAFWNVFDSFALVSAFPFFSHIAARPQASRALARDLALFPVPTSPNAPPPLMSTKRIVTPCLSTEVCGRRSYLSARRLACRLLQTRLQTAAELPRALLSLLAEATWTRASA